MNFIYLYVGMSGQKLVDSINSNLKDIKNKFIDNDEKIQVRIVSNEIKEIKEIDGVLYYTKDDIDNENREWLPLQSSWGKIVGNIVDQEDLKDILDKKASTLVVDNLSNNLESLSGTVSNISLNVSSLSDIINSIVNTIDGNNGILFRLDTIETVLPKKISSEQVKSLRTSDGLSLEFTLDGETWHPISSAGVVEWGDITGDITNQADLQKFMNDLVELVSSLNDTIDEHIKNTNNPHNVTKTDVGLGNVDNTSDMDKPLSTEQKEYIDDIISNLPSSKFISLTEDEYKNLEIKDSSTFYFLI